jgi:hypothetical protein
VLAKGDKKAIKKLIKMAEMLDSGPHKGNQAENKKFSGRQKNALKVYGATNVLR